MNALFEAAISLQKITESVSSIRALK